MVFLSFFLFGSSVFVFPSDHILQRLFFTSGLLDRINTTEGRGSQSRFPDTSQTSVLLRSPSAGGQRWGAGQSWPGRLRPGPLSREGPRLTPMRSTLGQGASLLKCTWQSFSLTPTAQGLEAVLPTGAPGIRKP